eukprot:4769606-Prymnesium_polylepis.1
MGSQRAEPARVRPGEAQRDKSMEADHPAERLLEYGREVRHVGSQRAAAACPRPEDGGSTLR